MFSNNIDRRGAVPKHVYLCTFQRKMYSGLFCTLNCPPSIEVVSHQTFDWTVDRRVNRWPWFPCLACSFFGQETLLHFVSQPRCIMGTSEPLGKPNKMLGVTL